MGGERTGGARANGGEAGALERWTTGVGTDLRLALRRLRASPVYAVTAVGTLTLALVVVSAVFSLVNALFLAPLPYEDPGQLVAVFEADASTGEIGTVAPGDFFDWRREADSFSGMAAFNLWTATVGPPAGGGSAERVGASVTTPELFDLLGVRPALGSGFRPEHAGEPGTPPARVAILSHGLWTRMFGADPDIVGRTIDLDDTAYEVVGVMPADFRYPRSFLGPTPAELWAPIDFGGPLEGRGGNYLHVVGRLAPGAELADARREMTALADRLARTHPESNEGRSVALRPVDEQIFGDQRPVLLLLLGAAAMVLLVACVNMANLLLARGMARRREFAVRAALGSGRGAVFRQLLLEAGLLALLGGTAGVVVLVLGEVPLRVAAAPYLSSLAEIEVNLQVIGFTLLAALGSGLVFGALPALRLSRSDLRESLVQRGGTDEGGRARTLLVATEAGLTVVLVFGAALLGRSLLSMLAVSPGFAVERVVLAELRPPADAYAAGEEVVGFYDRLAGALEARPEIAAAGFVSDIPLTSENRGTSVRLPGGDPDDVRYVEYHTVSPGYLEAAGIRLLAGRDLAGTDGPDDPRVALVNRALARGLWDDGEPLGRTVLLGNADEPTRIVGVVETTVDDALDAPPEPRLYRPHAQYPVRTMALVARTTGSAREALPTLRPAVASVDPRVPVGDVTTMERHLGSSVSVPRGLAVVTLLFGGLALLLAAVGIYGVMSHSVEARTREMGVRAALGADRGRLVGLVLGNSLAVAGAGVAVGVVVALLAGRLLRSALFGVPTWDPVALGAAVLTVMAAGALAAWVPARRAARVDPLVAMRAE